MNRTLKGLDQTQMDFIDTVYVKLQTFDQACELIKIDRKAISALNTQLEPIWRPITKIRDKWKSKDIGGNFWDFYYWYSISEKSCHYCGISEEQLDELHKKGITNKRTTRGRTLELDRKKPNEEYNNLENLTYSCYWCNNAKTDTFSEEEFMIIGNAISEVWKNRLEK